MTISAPVLALCGASITTATVSVKGTISNFTDAGEIAPAYHIDVQVKPAITIICMMLFCLIGFVVARLVDGWYERKLPADNASDCSEKTRELLKLRFAIAAFEQLKVHDLNNSDTEIVLTREDIEMTAVNMSKGMTCDAMMNVGDNRGTTFHPATDRESRKNSRLAVMRDAFIGLKQKKETLTEFHEEQLIETCKVFTLTSSKEPMPLMPGDIAKKKHDVNSVQIMHHHLLTESFMHSKCMDPKDVPGCKNSDIFDLPVLMTTVEITSQSTGQTEIV